METGAPKVRELIILHSDIEPEFLCVLTGCIARHPVLDPGDGRGRPVEKAAFERHQKLYRVTPLQGNQPIVPQVVHRRKERIEEWLKAHATIKPAAKLIKQEQQPAMLSPADDLGFSMTHGSAGLHKSIALEFQVKLIKKHFICPLTWCLIIDPVMAKHNPNILFERAAIEEYIAEEGCNPVDGSPLSICDLWQDPADVRMLEGIARRYKVYPAGNADPGCVAPKVVIDLALSSDEEGEEMPPQGQQPGSAAAAAAAEMCHASPQQQMQQVFQTQPGQPEQPQQSPQQAAAVAHQEPGPAVAGTRPASEQLPYQQQQCQPGQDGSTAGGAAAEGNAGPRSAGGGCCSGPTATPLVVSPPASNPTAAAAVAVGLKQGQAAEAVLLARQPGQQQGLRDEAEPGSTAGTVTAAAATTGQQPRQRQRSRDYRQRLLHARGYLGIIQEHVNEWFGPTFVKGTVVVKMVLDKQLQDDMFLVSIRRDSTCKHVVRNACLLREAAGKWFLGWSRPCPDGPLHLLLRTPTALEALAAQGEGQREPNAGQVGGEALPQAATGTTARQTTAAEAKGLGMTAAPATTATAAPVPGTAVASALVAAAAAAASPSVARQQSSLQLAVAEGSQQGLARPHQQEQRGVRHAAEPGGTAGAAAALAASDRAMAAQGDEHEELVAGQLDQEAAVGGVPEAAGGDQQAQEGQEEVAAKRRQEVRRQPERRGRRPKRYRWEGFTAGVSSSDGTPDDEEDVNWSPDDGR